MGEELGLPPSVRKDFIDMTKVGPMGDLYVPPWVRRDFIDLATVGARGDLTASRSEASSGEIVDLAGSASRPPGLANARGIVSIAEAPSWLIAEHAPILIRKDGTTKYGPLRDPRLTLHDGQGQPHADPTAIQKAYADLGPIRSYENLDGVLPFPAIGVQIFEDPDFRRKILDMLKKLQSAALKRGWTLGELHTVAEKKGIGIVLDRIHQLIPSDCVACKIPAGFHVAGGPNIFDYVTILLKKMIIAFASESPEPSTVLHELLHVLNNLSKRDFQDEFDISSEQEHVAKDALASYLADLLHFSSRLRNFGPAHLWICWNAAMEHMSKEQLAAIDAMGTEFGIRAPGVGGVPAPTGPSD